MFDYSEEYGERPARRRRSYTGARRRRRQPSRRARRDAGVRHRTKAGMKTVVGRDNESKLVIWGWRPLRGGSQKVVATPRKSDCVVHTKSGAERHRFVCKVTTLPSGQSTLHTGFYDPSTRKMRIPDLNLVVSPSRNYFGRSIRRR